MHTPTQHPMPQQWTPPFAAPTPQGVPQPTPQTVPPFAQPHTAQQQWQQWQQQAAPQSLPGPSVGRHLSRAIDWNVREIEVTPRERKALVEAGVLEPRLQALLSWRRSSLLVALPVLLFTVALAFYAAQDTDTSSFTPLGVLCVWLPPLALTLVPLGVLFGIRRWTEVRATSKTLVAVWGLSIVLPLLTALVPIDLILDVDGLRAQVAGTGAEQVLEQAIQAGRVALAIQYALMLLPVVVSVPGGVLKGAQRVKSLFPTTALPGWFLVAVAPFYSMFVVVVFVMIDQLVGNPALLLAVGLFAATPLLFVVHRKHYTRAMTAEQARRDLGRASRMGGIMTLAGVALVLVFAFTGKVDGQRVVGSGDSASFSYLDLARTAFEVVSRGIFTSVVFCLIFLGVVFAEWRSNRDMPAEVRREHETEMQALSRYAEVR